MNIKSLLLGSAAALVAVSGARAADAVVAAEPEPVEYVRVCDVYGAGFFYIPGTETCLKISGYARVDIRGAEYFDKPRLAQLDDAGRIVVGSDDETYKNRGRFHLRVDARNETELGTLRSYAAVNWDYQDSYSGGVGEFTDGTTGTLWNTSDGVSVDHAYVELGGFRIGKTDSLFGTFTDYAGSVINDDIIDYSPDSTLQIAYTYTGSNGFSAALAVEEGDDNEAPLWHIDDYTPHVVGGVSLTQGWGKVALVGAYDSAWEEFTVKGRVDVNVTDTASLFVMAAWASDPNGYAPWSFHTTDDGDPASWAVWGGGSVQLSDKATFNAQLSYAESEDFAAVANFAYKRDRKSVV